MKSRFPIKTSTLSYYLLIIFGLGFSNVNLIYVCCCLAGLIASTYRLDTLYGPKSYSFISQINFCTQMYGMSVFNCLISLHFTIYKRKLIQIYDSLQKYEQKLCCWIGKESSRNYSLFKNIAIFLTITFIAIIFDLYQNRQNFAGINWLFLYTPHISIGLFVIRVTDLFKDVANYYQLLNLYLTKIGKTPGKTNLYSLYDVFGIYYDICEQVRQFNDSVGILLAFYLTLASPAILSFTFTFAMDSKMLIQGTVINKRQTFACDFWAVLYLIGIFMFIIKATSITRQKCKIRMTLQDIIISKNLGVMGKHFTYALLHENAEISASGFFQFNLKVSTKLILAWTTYLIFLLPFNEDL